MTEQKNRNLPPFFNEVRFMVFTFLIYWVDIVIALFLHLTQSKGSAGQKR